MPYMKEIFHFPGGMEIKKISHLAAGREENKKPERKRNGICRTKRKRQAGKREIVQSHSHEFPKG